MALLVSLISITCTLFFTPFITFFFGMVFLASIGKSLGVRRLYVKLLLKIFEYGRQHIEIAQRNKSRENSEDEKSEDEGGGKKVNINKTSLNNTKDTEPTKNGILHNNNGVSVISREDLILVPDPDQNYQALDKDENGLLKPKDRFPRSRSYETLKREFELSDCLDYIKAGVESIIEDQVTHRFEAEELRSWNLLTRTNRHYEFISWRITVIWIVGFFIRHLFLFPLRVLICFCGVVWMTFSAALVGLLPRGWCKRWLNALIHKISFRIMARSLSLVLTTHNKEFLPNGAGVCVANHTTPIDVVILSTESVFSMVMFMTVSMALVGYLPEGDFKRWILLKVNFISFALLCSSVSAVINYHNRENRPQCGICVANHTSPIDALVLANDNHYSLIGQTHGGFLGFLQRAIARASPHIWFERSEVKDREAVARRLREHVSDPHNPPILIFPEGTCINNTSVMQFKKGGFEVGGAIYPVAIKYDPKFGDAFWNSSRYSMLQYLYLMMTSWAIVCDVWYLPPMYKQENESSIDFANRVKAVIARQGGLVDLMWDGQLKRMKAKPEWKEKQQEVFSKRLKLD